MPIYENRYNSENYVCLNAEQQANLNRGRAAVNAIAEAAVSKLNGTMGCVVRLEGWYGVDYATISAELANSIHEKCDKKTQIVSASVFFKSSDELILIPICSQVKYS